MKEEWFKRAVGLTGIPGSGKSTVASIFADLGSEVIDADEISRSSLLPDGEAYELVVETFGQTILNSEVQLGSQFDSKHPLEINRAKLAAIVFADPEKKRALEKIVHPIVRKTAQIRAKSCPPDQLLVYDCPLLLEAHFNLGRDAEVPKSSVAGGAVFKSIVVVETSEQLACSRYMKRTGVTAERFNQVLAQQLPIALKVKYADFVIDNSGDLNSLQRNVLKVFQDLSKTLA